MRKIIQRKQTQPYTILTGDVREMLKTLADESIQCCVTSPPYWGLRDYGTEPQVWGGDAECEHIWQGKPQLVRREQVPDSKQCRSVGSSRDKITSAIFCKSCHAWRGHLGLEPTPELYVEHLVEIFREVRRVLRKDGTFWLNIGDCYAGSWGAQSRSGDETGVSGEQIKAHPRGQTRTGSLARTPGLKPKDLVGIPWRVAFALQADGWYLRSDIIWSKCLSGGNRLYARTQKGEMPSTLKDLARLRPETVQLWNGQNWTQVVRWNRVRRPQHPIEIVLRSGERIGCTDEHRWPTRRGIVRTDELRIGDILCSSHLPKPKNPTSPPALHAQEIGWFVGMYIAEGSSGKNGSVLQFAGHEKESDRHVKLMRIAAIYGGTARVHHTGGHAVTCNIYGPILRGILQQYVSGRTAKDKHLHPRCWARSNKFLHALLHGYLEGDGHRRKNEWRLGFTQNDALAADIRTIGARLGLSVRLKRTVSRIGEDVYPGWRGSIRELKHRRTNDNEIVSIGRSRARQFWDVQVSDQPHTFALASGVLTHNSNPMPESCRDRPTKAHEYIFLLTKSGRYFFDQEAVREQWADHREGNPGPAHSKYEDAGIHYRYTDRRDTKPQCSGRNVRTVWTIPTQPFSEPHFATFPEALPERCIRAGTSEWGCCPECGAAWVRVFSRVLKTFLGWRPTCECGGQAKSAEVSHPPVPCTVLDPFVGSGTTAIVAVRLGRKAIGIDLSEKYVDLTEKQLAVVTPGSSRRPKKFRLKRRKKLKCRRQNAKD